MRKSNWMMAGMNMVLGRVRRKKKVPLEEANSGGKCSLLLKVRYE